MTQNAQPRTDAPRTNREPEEIERKLSLLGEPHVAPLTNFVNRLRAAKPEAAVPYFDPTEAGINAKILFLLEAPGPRAALDKGSGFVSADNNDQTAQNVWCLEQEVGLDRSTEVVAWNVIPWYLGDGKKIRPAHLDDLKEAREATKELISMLTNLQVVILFGKPAAKAWGLLGLDLNAIEAPHPSPLSLNTNPHRRQEIRKALMDAMAKAKHLG